MVREREDAQQSEPLAALDPAILRGALEASAVPSALVSATGSFLWVNPALCDLLGRTAPQLLLSSWQEVTHPDDVAVDAALMAEVLSGQRESYRLRKRYLRPGGTLVWGDRTVSRVVGASGDFVALLSQIVDVSEQVLAGERYRALTEGSADFLTQSESDGTLSWVSDGIESLLGWTPAELIGTPATDLLHPDDRLTPEEIATFPAGPSDHYETRDSYLKRLRTRDGGYRYCSLTAVLMRDEAGSTVRVQGAWRDAQAETLAAQAAQQSRELLAGVLEAELDGHVIMTALRDDQGRIVDLECQEVNPAACAILGLTREEIVGRSLREIAPEAAATGRLAEYIAVIRTGEPVQWSAVQIGEARLGPDRYFDAHVVKVGDGVSYAFRDVTDRVRAERRLARSEERLRLVLETARDIQVQSSSAGEIEYVSPAVSSVLGWEPEELVGVQPLDLIHPEDRGVFTSVRAALADGERPTAIARVRRKDGSYAWIESAVAPVLDADGRLVGRTASWRDVGKRVEAERRLAESEERYRLLAENSSDAVFSATPDAVFDYISPSVEELLGWTPEQVVGLSPLDLIHPDDCAELVDRMAAVGRGEAVSFRARFHTAGGGYRWLGAVVHPVLDDSGSLVSRAGSWRDAEADVAAERALQDQRERFQAVLDTAIDPYITLTAVRDDSGGIADFSGDYANPAALAELGLKREQFHGARLGSLLPRSTRGEVIDICATTVLTGEPLVRDDFAFLAGSTAARPRLFDVRGAQLEDGISLTWRDITGRADKMRAVAESEERFRLMAHSSADVVMLCDNGVVGWVSPSLTAQLGWDPAGWLQHSSEEFIHPEDVESQRVAFAQVAAGASRVLRLRMRSRQGGYHWTEVHAGPYLDVSGRQEGIIASFRVIDAIVDRERWQEARAASDELTGLLNRNELRNQADRLLSAPVGASHVAVLYCDIDHFKAINDDFGHAVGDLVIRAVASRLKDNTRQEDLVGRVGGDEFIVVLRNVRDLAHAAAVAHKIREAVGGPVPLQGDATATVTLSIGVSLAMTDEPFEGLIERADAAMYRAKRAGRNQVGLAD